MLADPTNPLVGEEVAMLQNLGVTTDDGLIQSLKQQLTNGGATSVTHLLLGNSFMNKNDLKQAIFHWNLALDDRNNPNAVLAMNNLAIGYSMDTPPKFEEALALIDKAIELSQGASEFYDSKGEILERMGKFEEAITYYEKAIQAERHASPLVRNLVGCTRSSAKWDLADGHNTMISKIRDYMKANNIPERIRTMGRREPPRRK